MTDSGALLTFLQAAIASVNVSSNLGDARADLTLLLNVLSKTERANIQFVTMPVEEPSWDPNRRIASEPMARNVWNALKNDQGLPVGTKYTDGNGAQLVVPDPTAATASPSPAPTDDTTTSRMVTRPRIPPITLSSPRPSLTMRRTKPPPRRTLKAARRKTNEHSSLVRTRPETPPPRLR